VSISAYEALQLYKAITTRASEVGLDWIVTELEEQLSLGSVAPRSLAVKNERDLFSLDDGKPTRSRRSKETFLVARPYSPLERLQLLADSLLNGVVQLNSISDEVVEFAVSEMDSSSITFSPEAEVRPPFTIEASDSRNREASKRLESLLSELKREAADAD
jgi:hypothetical protein